MNLRQANPGHVLVIPKVHIEMVYDLSPEQSAQLFQTVATVARAIRASLAPRGLSLWQSNGAVAGQEIPHVHIHLLPRRLGDDAIRFYPQPPPISDRMELDRLAAQIRSFASTL